MNFHKLENGKIGIAIAADGSRLIVSSPQSAMVYDTTDYASFYYANTYIYGLSGRARTQIEASDEKITIVFDQVDYRVRFPESGFKKPDPGPNLRFTLSISLADDEAVFAVESVEGLDDETVHISFPHRPLRWNPKTQAELAFSEGTFGSLWSFPTSTNGRYQSRHEQLPFAALYNSKGGIAFRIMTPFDQITEYVVSDTTGHTEINLNP